MAARFPRPSGVGVVEISGVIGMGLRVPTYTRILDGIRTDRRFKAVVVEIDSPGGTASGSEALYNGLVRGSPGEAGGGLYKGYGCLRRLLHKALPPTRSWPCRRRWWAL